MLRQAVGAVYRRRRRLSLRMDQVGRLACRRAARSTVRDRHFAQHGQQGIGRLAPAGARVGDTNRHIDARATELLRCQAIEL